MPQGNRLVEGSRYPETDEFSGWALIAADLPKPTPEEIQFEHLRHLVSIREDLLPYLGLPVGWKFEIFADGSWHAWPPKDRLLTWIQSFLDGSEDTPDAAIAIAELVSEGFGGTDLQGKVEAPLREWANDSHGRDAPRKALEWGLDWLSASDVR